MLGFINALKYISINILTIPGSVYLIFAPGVHRLMGVGFNVEDQKTGKITSLIYAPHPEDTYESFTQALLKNFRVIVEEEGKPKSKYFYLANLSDNVYFHVREDYQPPTDDELVVKLKQLNEGLRVVVSTAVDTEALLIHNVFKRANNLAYKVSKGIDSPVKNIRPSIIIDYQDFLAPTLNGVHPKPILRAKETFNNEVYTYDYHYQYSLYKGNCYVTYVPDGYVPDWPKLNQLIERIDLAPSDYVDEIGFCVYRADVDAETVCCSIDDSLVNDLVGLALDTQTDQDERFEDHEDLISIGVFDINKSVSTHLGVSPRRLNLLVVHQVVDEDYYEQINDYRKTLNIVRHAKGDSKFDPYYLTYVYSTMMDFDGPILGHIGEQHSLFALRSMTQAHGAIPETLETDLQPH